MSLNVVICDVTCPQCSSHAYVRCTKSPRDPLDRRTLGSEMNMSEAQMSNKMKVADVGSAVPLSRYRSWTHYMGLACMGHISAV